MARKIKDIIKFICITGIISAFFCLTGIPKVQSETVSLDKCQSPEIMAEDFSFIMQDNATDVYEPDVVNQCVLSSGLTALSQLQLCDDDDPACLAATVASVVIDIIQCNNSNDQDIIIGTCMLEALIFMTRNISACRDDPVCAVSNIISMLLDTIQCRDIQF
jgi:hypothetical protein